MSECLIFAFHRLGNEYHSDKEVVQPLKFDICNQNVILRWCNIQNAGPPMRYFLIKAPVHFEI